MRQTSKQLAENKIDAEIIRYRIRHFGHRAVLDEPFYHQPEKNMVADLNIIPVPVKKL